MTESIGKAKLWMSDCRLPDDNDDDHDDENWKYIENYI